MYCGHCGREVPDNVIVCGYCGYSIAPENLGEQARAQMAQNYRSDESLKPNRHMGVRVFGIVLMIVSGILDLVSIALIAAGPGSVGAFSALLIVGMICFFLGLVLTFAFRG